MPTKTAKTFADLFREARLSDTYWVETAILEFISDIHAEMKRQKKTKSDLAAIIGTSPAYITKVFGGNANFTIETMVKLSRALGCRLHVKAVPDNLKVSWINAPIHRDCKSSTPSVTTSDSYVPQRLDYANGSIAA